MYTCAFYLFPPLIFSNCSLPHVLAILGLLLPNNYVTIAPFLHDAILNALGMIEVSASEKFVMLLAHVARVAPSIVRLHQSAILKVRTDDFGFFLSVHRLPCRIWTSPISE